LRACPTIQCSDFSNHSQSGGGRSLNLIFVSYRPAETDEQAIANQSIGVSSIAICDVAYMPQIATDDCADLLGIKTVYESRRVHQIAKQNC
jgi:hypothetical protein